MQQAIDKLGTFRGQVGNGPITMYLNHWDGQLRSCLVASVKFLKWNLYTFEILNID